MDTVYAIFSGAYSDWKVHGFFTKRSDADKYCALKNRNTGAYDHFYVLELDKIETDVSRLKVNYLHEVVFDFQTGMQDEPDRYECYLGEKKPESAIYNSRKSEEWIRFSVHAETRKKAEKIAQDKFADFMNNYQETKSWSKAAKLIGAKSNY